MKDIHTKDALQSDLLRRGFTVDEAQAVISCSKPAVQFAMRPKGEEVPIGASKVSGLPDLPKGITWPDRPAYGNREDRLRQTQESIDKLQAGQSKWVPPHLIPVTVERLRNDAELLSRPSPLPFIGQINLADAWQVQPDLPPEMPRSGLLSLFFDVYSDIDGSQLGDDAGWRLIYTDSSELAPLALPPAMDAVIAQDRALKERHRRDKLIGDARKKQGWFDRLRQRAPDVSVTHLPAIAPYFPPERGMAPFASVTLADIDIMYDALCQVTPGYSRDDETTPFMMLWDDNFAYDQDQRFNQLCGHPNAIQGPEMPEEAQYLSNGARWSAAEDQVLRERLKPGAEDWILIAQFGSNDGVWMFGDLGFLYVWMRKQDLAARAFDRAWVFLQSH